MRDLRSSRSVARYTLRRSGLTAGVRHPLLDMWAIEEMFRFRPYEPPEPVRRALDGVEGPLGVVDIGGHAGYFGLFIRDLFPDASVISFEPDPSNAGILRSNIEANGLADRWELIQAGAATTTGTAEFESSFHLSRVVPQRDSALEDLQQEIGEALPFLQGTALLESERRQIELRDVFSYLDEVDLLKIDAEGAEWDILADPRFADVPARAVVLEYHPSYTDSADPARLAASLLERAGFQPGPPERGGQAGTMWAWKPAPEA